MTMQNVSLLVDGVILRGDGRRIAEMPGAVGLYADIGDEAAAVGPWLIPGADLKQFGSLDLPERHGVSELHHMVEVRQLIAHLANMRQIRTDDGQAFYLRYADMRSLAAVDTVLTPKQRSALWGCVHRWRYVDRHGEARELHAPGGPDRASDSSNIVLSTGQLEALINAMLPDQLCLAVVELGDERLRPDRLPQQFRHIEAAAHYIRAHDITSFALQRAIARQAVVSAGQALAAPAFNEAVSRSVATSSPSFIDACWPTVENMEEQR